MKQRSALLCLSVLLACLPSPLPAQQPDQPLEALARFECFSLPPDAARRAMRQFPKEDDLYAWLGAALEKEKPEVRLEKLALIKVREGQQSKLEEIVELPYPTVYNPNQIPQFFSVAASPPAVAPAAPGAGAVPAPGSVPARLFPPWPYTPSTPESFTFRNAGWTMELNVKTREEGKVFDVTLAPEFIRFRGMVCHVTSGEEPQPVFDTGKFNTRFVTKYGRHTLAGTMNPVVNAGTPDGNTESRTWIVFLTLSGTESTPAPSIEPKETAAAGKEALLRFDLISLPPLAARKALLQHPEEADLYEWLDRELARKGSGVSLDQTSTLRSLSGGRTKLDSTTGYPYATEIEPPQIPQSISLGVATPPPHLPAGPGRVFPPWPLTPATLGGFTFRDLGSSTEVELAITGDGKTFDLNFASAISRLTALMPQGVTGEFTQPVFESRKMHAFLFVPSGGTVLAGTLNCPVGTGAPGESTADRVSLLFVTATLLE